MAHFERALRAWGIALSMATLGVGCQAVFGDFHVDDSAFGASGAANGGTGAQAGDGTGGNGGAGQVQTGPIRLMPTVGLYTTEWGGQATFSIVLAQQPTADVTVDLSSSNTNEGRVSPASVKFTKVDWKAPQVVTVTGVDDTAPDGNQPYQILTAPAVSDDQAFAGFDAIDLSLTNIDNETAGITVTPTSGLVTSESGAQDTFTVVLNSKPAADVTVDLMSSKPTEGTVSPESLVFTALNWMAPQLVTVSGVDDADKDGPQAYTINTQPAASDDPTYKGVDASDVQVTNQDNETAGVTVMLVTGVDPVNPTKLRTSESGDAATFTVQLNAPPGADVTIPLSSSVETEGKVSPASLTFTKDNWKAPQTVTVMGINDDAADGNQPYDIVLGAASSDDTDYDGIDADDVPATNVDNDKPGFTIMLVSGIDPKDSTKLLTTEAGATATFTLALNSKPTKPVKVSLASSLTSEGVVSPPSLTFTDVNWQSPQTVSVKGVDDAVQDGSPLFFVRTGAAESEDPGYDKADPPDVQVTNEDNDSAGVHVTPTTGLVTGENGDTATFTVALTSAPTADVSIALVSSNVKEGTISPSSLKFTSANYGAPQTITITGVDDKSVDGNQPYVIAVGAASSKDVNFNLHFGQQVQVTNRDNDSAGVIVTAAPGLTTSESGKTATFTIQLQSQPAKDVDIGVTSSDAGEGKPNVSSVKFTSQNWNAPQTITVTGVDDDVADGNPTYKILIASPTSQDPNYAAGKLSASFVTLTNLDNDSAGIVVTPTSGLSTTEGGGTATFTVVLQSQPVGTNVQVNINVSSSRPSEGTVSPAKLTFTDQNWKAAQVVTVTGVDDKAADGPQPYLIVMAPASSIDGNYNGRKASDVQVTNVDNDSAGIRITQAQVPGSTTEKLGSSTFTVVLNSMPSAPVTYSLKSTNTDEGTVSPSSLTFTGVNWNAPQTVTVTGVDDSIADNDQPYKVHISDGVSTDSGYGGMFATDVSFINVDDDHPGYVINAASSLQTKENGVTATFTVSLLSQPAAAVTIGLSSSNTDEGTVSPASLVFNAGNWQTAQTVTVTGVNDDFADGPQTFAINLANAVSTDGKYSGQYATQVGVTNLDDDQAGFMVLAANNLQTTEKAGSATFTVALLSRPTKTNTVTMNLTSSNTKEGTVTPSSLLFNTSNWSEPQRVTVTGVNDPVPVADGNQMYSINFSPAVSGDVGYSGKFPTAVSLTNVDDDVAQVLVTPTSCSTTPGATATFTVVLTSQPEAAVSISLASDTPTEGTVSPDTVTFTAVDWNVEQTVTVTGVDDGTMGAITNYKIITGNASSPGEMTGYDNAIVPDVSCSNTTPLPPAATP